MTSKRLYAKHKKAKTEEERYKYLSAAVSKYKKERPFANVATVLGAIGLTVDLYVPVILFVLKYVFSRVLTPPQAVASFLSYVDTLISTDRGMIILIVTATFTLWIGFVIGLIYRLVPRKKDAAYSGTTSEKTKQLLQDANNLKHPVVCSGAFLGFLYIPSVFIIGIPAFLYLRSEAYPHLKQLIYTESSLAGSVVSLTCMVLFGAAIMFILALLIAIVFPFIWTFAICGCSTESLDKLRLRLCEGRVAVPINAESSEKTRRKKKQSDKEEPDSSEQQENDTDHSDSSPSSPSSPSDMEATKPAEESGSPERSNI